MESDLFSYVPKTTSVYEKGAERKSGNAALTGSYDWVTLVTLDNADERRREKIDFDSRKI